MPERPATVVDGRAIIFTDGATRKTTLRERFRWWLGPLVVRLGNWITPSTAKRRNAKHEFVC